MYQTLKILFENQKVYDTYYSFKRGKEILAIVPFPSSLSNPRVPPGCSSIILLETTSPKPVPCRLVVKKGVNNLSGLWVGSRGHCRKC